MISGYKCQDILCPALDLLMSLLIDKLLRKILEKQMVATILLMRMWMVRTILLMRMLTTKIMKQLLSDEDDEEIYLEDTILMK